MQNFDFEEIYSLGYQEVTTIPIKSIIDRLQQVYNEDYEVEETSIIPAKNPEYFNKTLSTEFGLNKFPFHTDGAHRLIPPRWTILEYIGKENSTTATLIADTLHVQRNPDYEDILFNDVYIVEGGKSPILTTIINRILYKAPILRWNPLIMRKISRKNHDDFNKIKFNSIERIIWIPTKTIIIDNWRCVHGREAVVGEENSRKIKRYNLTPII